jgi:hypothetical protein
MATSWSTAAWTKDGDVRHPADRRRVVQAWDKSSRMTACGKPDNGMIPSTSPWSGLVLDRCPECVERTAG